jgi:two-component system sensor histidine kinase CpxA
MWGVIYKNNIEYWRSNNDSVRFDILDYGSYNDSELLSKSQQVNIPHYVSTGDILDYPATYVDAGMFQYLFVIDYKFPNEVNNFLPSIFLAIIFMFGLFLFVRNYLFPIQLMKARVRALENGDLDSKIEIIGEDELADLSKTINNMVNDIKVLLDKKQRLLADVSHELRSPLARMQLLIELLPSHKNKDRLREQVGFLEGMISNLLISDKLSTPYSSLDKKNVHISNIIDKCMAMVPNSDSKILLVGKVPNTKIEVDEFKVILALRNLIDNALKYAPSKRPVEISILSTNKAITFDVKDFGSGIPEELIENLTQPFYRIKTRNSARKNGFGLGLTICKKIVEAHGGSLRIKNNKNVGSTFSIAFPLK